MTPNVTTDDGSLATRLPAGYVHAYISRITAREDNTGIASITVSDWNTREELFTSTDGSGDTRGYPACLHASIQDTLAERYAVLNEPDNFPDGMTWEDMAAMHEADMESTPELDAQQFVLQRHDPAQHRASDGPERNEAACYAWLFKGWLPSIDPCYDPDVDAFRDALHDAIRS